MSGQLIPEEVWQLIEPLLPKRPPHPKGGRPVIADRDVLTGIIFMLKTGIAWEDLPTEMGCGCGMTCLRRLREWQQAGVWPQVQNILQTHLRESWRMDWSRLRARMTPRRSADRPDLFAPPAAPRTKPSLPGLTAPTLRNGTDDRPQGLTLSRQEATQQDCT
jgi:transposase